MRQRKKKNILQANPVRQVNRDKKGNSALKLAGGAVSLVGKVQGKDNNSRGILALSAFLKRTAIDPLLDGKRERLRQLREAVTEMSESGREAQFKNFIEAMFKCVITPVWKVISFWAYL